MDLNEIIGNRIRDLRERNQWTQTDLSKKIQITRSSIANIESGRQKLQIDTLYQIAFALNTEIHSILPTLKEIQEENHEDAFEFLEETQLLTEELEWLKTIILKGKNSNSRDKNE